ncbi:MAG: hypothetical protein ACYCYE_03510 [Clostridia bacterium]
MVRDNILGFVTISEPVNERKYDQSLFELIESLASSTYISLSIKEEEILLVYTVANSIAPTINHMNSVQQVKREYIINQRAEFIKGISAKYSNREKYLINFHIYYKKILVLPFTDPDLSDYTENEYY